MMDFSLLKNWKILMMIFCIVLAIISINPIVKGGVVIKSVDQTSPFYGVVKVGETLDWANEKSITSVIDVQKYENYTGMFRFMHSGKLDLVDIKTPGLGMIVEKRSATNIKLGMDMIGGTRVLLQPNENNITDDTMQQIKASLETRINTYGLKEVIVQPIKDFSGQQYVQVEMAGGSRGEIDDLLARQGKFEGKVPMVVTFTKDVGTLKLGDEEYAVKYNNNSIEVNSKTLYLNDTFKLDDIDFQVLNITDTDAILVSTVFKGDDVTSVCMIDQPGICSSRLQQVTSGWSFSFQVFITQKSAEKFASVTKNMKSFVNPNTGESYLESRIYLYLDGNEIENLGISSDLAGKAYTTPAITGGGKDKEEAIQEKLKLQSILKSGALPVGLNVIRADDISPSLGREFLNDAFKIVLVAVIAVAFVIYLRYRKIKILIPMMIWSLSELILTLGVASAINWTMDLASITGLIAAIGTGTNDQIMIIDEIMLGEREKIYTMKQKVKKAFSIVFSTAATIIAAMVPLFFVGIGIMKGFAITTTIGILIGVFITRGAFAIVMEQVLQKASDKAANRAKAVEQSKQSQ